MAGANSNKLPTGVVNKAIGIIETQGPTPLSPGVRKHDGGVALCAAAALAHAGLEVSGRPQRITEFHEEILRAKSAEPIRKVFGELGWSTEICDRAVYKNDSLRGAARQAGVIGYLKLL